MLTLAGESHAARRHHTFLLADQRWREALSDRQARLAGTAQHSPTFPAGARQPDESAARRYQHDRRPEAAVYFQLPPTALAEHLDKHAVCARTRSDRGGRRVSSRLV